MKPRLPIPAAAFLILPTALSLFGSAAVAQTPGMYQPYGQGCSSGAVKPLLYAAKLPVIGREVVFTITNVKPNNVGMLAFGSSKSKWGSTNLPFDLTVIGAPGCWLLTGIEQPVPLSTNSGTAYLQRNLPKSPSLVGITFYNQFLSPDAQANAAGLAVSNGAMATVGNCLCVPPQAVVEDFTSDAMLDKDFSGGTWAGGTGIAAIVGGTGRLGDFDYRIGAKSGSVYVWSTDSMTIPATHTETGKSETITDGVFEFSRMVVPSGITVRFVGTRPAQIRVRGIAQIDGTIEGNGADGKFFLAVPSPGAPVNTGEAGSAGGPGGGNGGAGGNACLNKGANTLFDGRPGNDVRLKSGHAYAAQAAGTGGKGSPHWPRSGKNTRYCALTGLFAGGVAAGGGGGGFTKKGQDGVATKTACNIAADLGTAPNSAGIAFPIGTLAPRTTGPNASLDHYAVGGSGGGGGGSHPLLTRASPYDKWIPGSGGTGGGGVLAFRIGRHLGMNPSGVIECRGGTGYVIDSVPSTGEGSDNLFNVPAAGGAGSGGTVLLQVDGTTRLLGTLDSSGGIGGVLDNTPANQPGLFTKARGGDGGPGYLRLEKVVAPSPNELGTTRPAVDGNNVGKLVDYDIKVTTQSRIYNTGLSFSPHFLRYEVEATVGGTTRVYSDDPNLKNPNYAGPASAGQPIQFRIQGSRIDQAKSKLEWIGQWRDNVRAGAANSLDDDDANSWRFQMVYDRTTTTNITVKKVTIWFQR